LARASRCMKSGTKTSRDLKRDRIHDWKAPANHLDSTIPHIPAQNNINLQTIVATTTPFNATTNHALRPAKSRRIARVATATTFWTCDKRLRGPIAAGRAIRNFGGIQESNRVRAQRQWRAHKRARRVKEDDPVSAGRADQDRQGRVWEKRRDGVAAQQQPVGRKRTPHKKCATYWHAC
jgi:hypothetical protein